MDLHRGISTEKKVVEDLAEGGADAALGAVAILAVDKLIKPANCRVIDRLSNVEPEIEATVVATAEHQHELSGLVLGLADLEIGVFFDDVVGVEERGLVPEVLAALAEVFGEEGLRLALEDVGLVNWDAVPKLGFSLVQVVDGREVEVLLVPAEESLP